MERTRRSRTVEIPAIMRALHQTIDDEPKILADPIAVRLMGPPNDYRWLAAMLDHPFARHWRGGFALRARYAEDCLAHGVDRGVTQYVILGAGLDTFACRQPSWSRRLHIFELDHPMTQHWKQDRLRLAGIEVPPNVTFVPIDFERVAVADALASTAFDCGARTCCSWMGVTQYLTRDALDATFRFTLSLPRSSEIVFSFVLPLDAVTGIESDAMKLAAQRAGEMGEPWVAFFQPEELVRRLHALGFSEVIHLTPEEIRDRYFSGRRDGLHERRGEQLMRAIV
jgi:methyltransferase (TIGR00027 family)